MTEERTLDNADLSPANLFLYDAKRAEMTGICDVLNFTDSNITAVCKFGIMSIDGLSLKIESFDSQSETLSVTGDFFGFYYIEKNKKSRKKKGPFSG